MCACALGTSAVLLSSLPLLLLKDEESGLCLCSAAAVLDLDQVKGGSVG